MHKQNINYIIDHGTNEQMRELKDVLVEAVIKLKDLSPTEYKDVEYNIKYIDDNNNIERIIKIQVESVEEGNVIENEDNNNDIFKVVEIEPEQESEEM